MAAIAFVVAAAAGLVGIRVLEPSSSSSGTATSGPPATSPASTSAQATPSQATPTLPAPTASGPVLDTDAIVARIDPAVVDITTSVDGGVAAGTGMVLSSSGLVLTNNHVIEGATSIDVQIAGTGPTYSAHVLGYAVTDDIAVIQLDDASGLATIAVGDSSDVQVGDDVVAIGNALGASGPHAVTTGTIQALDQTITAGDESGSSQTLEGLIQSNAPLRPGDSGGALVNDAGQVIGMNSAAEASARRRVPTASTVGYAIPIDDALAVAQQIIDGESSATVHIGDRAILGIQVREQPEGVLVVGVAEGSPAADAGLQSGDVVTDIDDTSIASMTDLQDALGSLVPGDQVRVGWTSPTAGPQSATVTLVAGPPA
jgi:S1-C subfamily serine protease